jgi:hypothetical protein
MKVLNIHERKLEVDATLVGALIDSLAGKKDRLWPNRLWPRMEFDRPLEVGATGGHGPIRYFVEEYVQGKSIKFRFTGPKGFDGYHGFEILNNDENLVILRHTLEMNTHGPALLTWPLAYRPMHDALIEDSLAVGQVSLGLPPKIRPWSLWVRFLRWALSGGRMGPQVISGNRGK